MEEEVENEEKGEGEEEEREKGEEERKEGEKERHKETKQMLLPKVKGEPRATPRF